MLSSLRTAHKAGKLTFFGEHAHLADRRAFAAFLRPWRKADWVVYAKEPFGGPRQVLRYLSRYTHRVAISNRRLIAADQNGVTFRYKDYRIDGPARYKTMTLDPHEFIRRFLMHDLGINRKACSRPTQGPPGISPINYLLTPIPASTRRKQAAVLQREVDHA